MSLETEQLGEEGSGKSGSPVFRSIAVQVILDSGQEAELRFLADAFRVESGCLTLLRSGSPELPIAAFAAGSWRGAWAIDPASDAPLGLDPLSRPQAASDLRGFSLISQTLAVHPYAGIDSLASEAGISPRDAERIALLALQERLLDPSLLAISSEQSLLDSRMPELLRSDKGSDKSPARLLSLARGIPGLERTDLIQLRVWAARQKSQTNG